MKLYHTYEPIMCPCDRRETHVIHLMKWTDSFHENINGNTFIAWLMHMSL